MYAAPKHDRDRIDGVAVFAGAAFLTGMGLVAALARVGAPDRLVEALGPLIALFGLVTIGALTRTARLADFLAARRAVPPAYGGLAFAATAAGLVLALDAGPTGRSPLPWPAVALGLGGAALIVGPLVRRASASALSDVLATRFPAAPTRLGLRYRALRRRRVDCDGGARRRGRRSRRACRAEPARGRSHRRALAGADHRSRRLEGLAVERRGERRRRAGDRGDRRGSGVERRRRAGDAARRGGRRLARPVAGRTPTRLPACSARLARSASARSSPFDPPAIGAPPSAAPARRAVRPRVRPRRPRAGRDRPCPRFGRRARRRVRRPRARSSAPRRGCPPSRSRAPAFYGAARAAGVDLVGRLRPLRGAGEPPHRACSLDDARRHRRRRRRRRTSGSSIPREPWLSRWRSISR